MIRGIALLALGLALSSCGIAAKVESRNDYQASAANYKACLTENAASPDRCEGYRLAMETDERKYNAMSAGIVRGAQRTNTVTILNR